MAEDQVDGKTGAAPMKSGSAGRVRRAQPAFRAATRSDLERLWSWVEATWLDDRDTALAIHQQLEQPRPSRDAVRDWADDELLTGALAVARDNRMLNVEPAELTFGAFRDAVQQQARDEGAQKNRSRVLQDGDAELVGITILA